ncbi:hypothetical protein FOC4_g10004917 [Fusarium odoratissimum]|uniref:NACHT domain-containing protein n=1 Tax=Fusarium oxysporum f. sp. cubense (strain race 4) TaxID=2502994 RepID=N1RSH4_FUSC4|nr:hypothetical protein FOC4_g10004917 [Fusarium odoratissimum]
MADPSRAAASLKPDIRLAQAISMLLANLPDEQRRSFRTQGEELSPPTITDVMRVVAEVDMVTRGKQKGSSRAFGPRLTNFLEAVQEFASIGEVVLGGSMSSLAASVWLIVRLTIMMLAEYPRWLEKVSTMLMSAGRTAPRRMEISMFYARSKHLQSCLHEYFSVVVHTCHYIVKSLQSSIFAKFISFATDSKLKGYESDLERWATMIKEEMKILQSQPAPTRTDDFANIFPNSGKSKLQTKNLAHNLEVAERYSTYDYLTAWKRIRKCGSTSLFTLLPKYQSFIACNGSSTLLYLGQAGAGKSVILANMVDDLVQRQSDSTQIAFFFCRWDQTDSLQAITILYCLYRQLLENRQDRFLFLEDVHDGSSDSRLMTNVLRDALNTSKKTYIVLDGLDGCQETERAKVISVLQALQAHSSLSICLSSRPGTLSHIGWTELHLIYILEDNPDIEFFVDSELSRRFEQGALEVGNPALGGKIRSALKESANGNFVRVQKQIDLLCEQNTDRDILQLLSDFTESPFDASDTEALPVQTTPVAPSAFTDSAYASASFTDRSGKNPDDDKGAEDSLGGPDGNDVDDGATEYSDVSSTTFSRKRLYISELATDLYNRVSSGSSNAGQITQVSISDTLPSLLKAFALKIGYCATSQMHRDVMAFVHRHRSEITAAFLEICLTQGEVEPGETRDQSGSMSLQERMDLWDKNEDMDGTSVEEGLESLEIWDGDEEDMYEDADIWVAAYRDFAPNTEAYTWLLTQLQRDMDSTQQEPPAIQLIRDQILSSLPPPHRVSRSIASKPCSVLFEIDWDIVEFFDSQQYSKPPDEALPRVITLTGSSSDAQASNCAQFLKQTWPVTGEMMLHLTGDLLKQEQAGPHHNIANGHCWHGIFKNPIIVKGFPILSKLQKDTGLEIPLSLMAGLARAQRVDRFNDKVYIKGFSTMLVPTKQIKDAVYWHLIYQEDGCRISYLADNLQRDVDLGSLDFASCRHILGWCSEAKFYAGSSFELGIKDTPAHVAPFIFKADDLQESPKPFTADSAIDVLINPTNQALKLYPERNGFIVLADRIDQYYNLLEKMLDHQTDIARRHSANLEKMPRKYLEGWDFEDLSANRDPLHPRLVTLDPAGKGWVDLTRALQAVTLTGRGFGELVRPVGPASCETWSQLPHVGPPTQQQPWEEVTVSHISDGADKDSGVGASLVTSSTEGHVNSIRSSSISRQLSPVKRTPESGAIPLSESKYYARNQYTVGILCALPIELKAIRALFDQRHQNMASVLGDNNQYALGEISQHLVVATSLPAGEYGTNAAASAISDMTRSFMSINFCLLVGIAGGAPSEGDDIRLGDVVVSLPTSTFPGVLQYDLGKENEGSDFEVTGVLRRPPRILTNAISKIRSDPDIGLDALNPYLAEIVKSLPSYGNPGQELDVLFRASCSRRTSGNRVIKDATLRDRLSRKFGVLCFEMEAAGVMNRTDCLVIRGICDYSDAQKNKVWQNYAAAVAAAYTKLLLSAVAVVNDLPVNLVRSDNEPVFKKRKIDTGNEGHE